MTRYSCLSSNRKLTINLSKASINLSRMYVRCTALDANRSLDTSKRQLHFDHNTMLSVHEIRAERIHVRQRIFLYSSTPRIGLLCVLITESLYLEFVYLRIRCRHIFAVSVQKNDEYLLPHTEKCPRGSPPTSYIHCDFCRIRCLFTDGIEEFH